MIDRATLDNDAEIARRVKCPHCKCNCEYHAEYDGTYHAYAVCPKCRWRKEF